MRLRLLSIFTVLLATTGCMSNDTIDDVDVNQDKLFGHYYAGFDSNSGDLDVRVQLRVGGKTGTTVRLLEGELAVDGHAMSEQYGEAQALNLQGTYYYLKRSLAEFSPVHTVDWDRSDGERVTNDLRIPGPAWITSPAEGDVVGRDNIVLRFDGIELDGHIIAKMVLEILDPAGNNRRRTISKVITAGNEFVFTRTDLVGINGGSRIIAHLKLQTRYRPEVGHTAEGGMVKTEYRAARVEYEFAR